MDGSDRRVKPRAIVADQDSTYNKRMSLVDDARIDKTAFSVGSLDDEGDEKAFWLSKTPQERMAAMELMRQIAYGSPCRTSRSINTRPAGTKISQISITCRNAVPSFAGKDSRAERAGKDSRTSRILDIRTIRCFSKCDTNST